MRNKKTFGKRNNNQEDYETYFRPHILCNVYVERIGNLLGLEQPPLLVAVPRPPPRFWAIDIWYLPDTIQYNDDTGQQQSKVCTNNTYHMCLKNLGNVLPFRNFWGFSSIERMLPGKTPPSSRKMGPHIPVSAVRRASVCSTHSQNIQDTNKRRKECLQ